MAILNNAPHPSPKQLAQFEETHRRIDETIRSLGKSGVAELHVREIRDSWSRGSELAGEALAIAMRTTSASGGVALSTNGTIAALARAHVAAQAIKVDI